MTQQNQSPVVTDEWLIEGLRSEARARTANAMDQNAEDTVEWIAADRLEAALSSGGVRDWDDIEFLFGRYEHARQSGKVERDAFFAALSAIEPTQAPKPNLDEKVRLAVERFNSLSPEEQAAHRAEQAKSFARGMAPCEHGVADWEDCADCRKSTQAPNGEAVVRQSKTGLPCCKDIPQSGRTEADDPCDLCAERPSHAEIVAPYAAALRMIRDAVGELFGPVSNLESEEAVLLRGPEPHHEAEAIIAGLQRVKDEDTGKWKAACLEAREGCNQRSATIRSLRRHLETAEARVAELEKERDTLRRIVHRYGDRLRMANAPSDLQQAIDDAMGAALHPEREG